MRNDLQIGGSGKASGLVDVLDRVLDKGLVVAGDIKVSLAEVELLTIRIRLIVCSLDKAQEIGLDWWRYDHYLTPGRQQQNQLEADELRRQVKLLEAKVAELQEPAPRRSLKAGKRKNAVRRKPSNRE